MFHWDCSQKHNNFFQKQGIEGLNLQISIAALCLTGCFTYKFPAMWLKILFILLNIFWFSCQESVSIQRWHFNLSISRMFMTIFDLYRFSISSRSLNFLLLNIQEHLYFVNVKLNYSNSILISNTYHASNIFNKIY